MAKVGRFRNSALFIPVLLVVGTAPALAAHGRAGCGAPAGSAINQYCEALPSATGRSQPHVGSPSVANTLPPRTVHQLSDGTPAAQQLLTLPAAHKRHRHHAKPTAAGLTGPDASVWSLSLLMILILVALALGLGGIAFERRRRRSNNAPSGQ
jgi:hypothetical protein